MSPITKTGFGVSTSKDCKDGMEMLKACGGDFTIEKRQVAFAKDIPGTAGGVDADGNIIPETEWTPIKAFVPVRSDTCENISDCTIGDGYNVLQNSETVDVVNAICEGHGLNYDFMTLIQGGRGLAIQVYCPDLNDALGVGNDDMKGRLTTTNFHDGTGSMKVHVSICRMLCANVLPAIGREFNAQKKIKRPGVYSIKHTPKMEMRIRDMVKCYKDAMGDMIATAELLRLLADHKPSKSALNEYYMKCATAKAKRDLSEKEMTSRAIAQRDNRVQEFRDAARNPVNQVADASGSWYEALQAVTWYSTHNMRTRDTGRASLEESRFISANLTSGAELASDALRFAVEMSGVAA